VKETKGEEKAKKENMKEYVDKVKSKRRRRRENKMEKVVQEGRNTK
jgi:hypothetical protein